MEIQRAIGCRWPQDGQTAQERRHSRFTLMGFSSF